MSLLLDRQLSTKIDGFFLNSEEVPGAFRVLSLYLCHRHAQTLLHYLNGDTALRREAYRKMMRGETKRCSYLHSEG